MDPRTGKFTAPLAGTYMFIVHVCSADYRKALLSIRFVFKVHIFWEGHKILRNLLLTFDYSTYSLKLGEDFAKFCGLIRIYEL